ncbi:cupredoxin domain-containing protein [Candidatus Micrarchaeota archaeon]|nr:cupredoxin domain-containing protein [Candidatus Micrarchaeota archaeon]
MKWMLLVLGLALLGCVQTQPISDSPSFRDLDNRISQTVDQITPGENLDAQPPSELESAPDPQTLARQILLSENGLTPETTTVKTGTIVQWINYDSQKQKIISLEEELSEPLNYKEKFEKQFTEPGEYSFEELDSGVKGTVIVEG